MKGIFLALVILAIGATACSSEPGTITTMAVADFSAAIQDENVFVIDTHIPEQEHIEGTDAFIPYDALRANADLLPKDKDTPIAVYCRSGSMSAKAAQTLQDMGYKTVYDLEGGAKAWKAANMNLGDSSFVEATLSGTATIYKSPSCGCCVGYSGEIQDKGISVRTEPVGDMSIIKKKYNIPRNMESCHTMVIGDYFVEGHVPIEAVEKMLAEKPDIDGIALPGMPSGSPGMPGAKRGDWIIYSIKDGVSQEYMKI